MRAIGGALLVAFGVLVGVLIRERAPAVRVQTRENELPAEAQGARKLTEELTPKEELAAFMARVRGTRLGELRGRVVPEDGLPLGAAIELSLASVGNYGPEGEYSYSVTTSADGQFTISGVRYPADYTLVCRSNKLGLDHQQRVTMYESPRVVEVRVSPRTLATGIVVGSHGEAVPRAHVVVTADVQHNERSRLETGSATTDQAGRFTLAVPYVATRMQRLRVGARAPGYFAAEGRVIERGQASVRCEVVLEATGVVTGRIVDQNNTALRNVDIRIAARRSRRKGEPRANEWLTEHLGGYSAAYGSRTAASLTEMIVLRARSREDGTFAVSPAVKGDQYHLIAVRRGRPPWSRRVPELIENPTSEVQLGTIVLARQEPPVSVTFRYADGAVASGVKVVFQAAYVPMWVQLNSPPVVADQEGVVASRFLESGETYSIYVRAGPRHVHANLMEVEVVNGASLTIPD